MSFSLNTTTGVITQTGTDADLSGLASIAGVTVTNDDPGQGKITYDMGDLRMDIDGTLSHDPDRELMIFHHDKGTGSTSVSEPVLTISAGGTYNYGIKTTTSDGKVGYSSGCGLMFTGRGYSNWHPSDNAIYFGAQSASFICRGGVIECSRGLYFGGNADIEETVFLNASDRFSLEIRVFGNGNISTDRAHNVVLAGGISVMDAYRMTEQKIIFREGAISRVYGGYYEAELFDFDVSNNVFDYDIGNCSNTSQFIQDHHIVNSATGSDVRTMWRNTTGSVNNIGNTFIHKEVSFNIKDPSATAIEGVKLYMQDNPSSFAKSVSYTTTHTSGTYPTPTLATAVVSNAGKTISYDYTGAITYNKTTDANGDIAKFKVLTATQFLEYNLNSPGGATAYGINETTGGGVWKDNTTGLTPAYTDWDTSSFGNFFKVDRRSESNTNADDFNFKFCSYGHLLASSTQPLKGLGELQVDWTLFVDRKLTETNKTLVDQYAEINSAARFYDRAKSYLYDNFAGETDTIVDRDDITIDAGASDIVLIPTTAQGAVFAYDKATDTITIKCDSFTGNLKTTGDITIGTNITLLGTVTDASNPSGASTRTFSILNVIAGATVQIYNESRNTNYQTMIASGTTTNSTLIGDGTSSLSTLASNNSLTLDALADGSFVLPAGWSLTTTTVANDMSRVTIGGLYDEGDGTSSTKDFDLGETVRIRITCAASTGAFEPFLGTTLTNASGFSLKANQVADTIYNANGIDGSSAAIEADFEPDYVNFQIDTTETDGVVTVQEVYAYYAYLITTTDGIDKFFGAITPIDGMNYRINTSVVNLKLQNTTQYDTILKGGRIYRDDNTSVIDTGTGAGTGSFTHDTGFLLQYLQPQVESALDVAASATDMATVKSDVQSIKSNTGLIPGLL